MARQADVQFLGDCVIVPIPKAILVLTRRQFLEALRAGKRWTRRTAREQAIPKVGVDQDR